MTAKLLFVLLVSLLPLAVSIALARKGRLMVVRRCLSRSEKRANFAASLLAIVILLFHLAYSLAFPVTIGLAFSSLYAFFAIAVKRNTLLLLFIRSSMPIYLGISIAYTLSAVLITAACLPDIPQQNITESDTTKH